MAGNTQGTPGLGAIQRAAKANGIDWRAPAAIAYHESHLNPAAVGDNGTSFGFFQLHQGGALPAGTPISQATNPDWNANFAARAIKALGIQGLPVNQQIYQISKRFERPTNVAGEVSDAQNYYRTTLAGLGAGQRATPPAATGQTPAAPLSPPTQTTQSLAPLQASLALGQAQNQRALDALGKISGVKSTAAAAPDLSTLISNSATNVVAPSAPMHPVRDVSVKPGAQIPHDLDPQEKKAVELAQSYLGDKYVFGGSTHQGIDCSGLISAIYSKLGINLPHNAAAQYQLGKPVDLANLQPGQAVFFRNSEGIHHVGLYVGGPNKSFINAPHTGAVVRFASLNDPYYKAQFAGGRAYA